MPRSDETYASADRVGGLGAVLRCGLEPHIVRCLRDEAHQVLVVVCIQCI